MSTEVITIGGSLYDQSILSPNALKIQLPLHPDNAAHITQSRHTIANIITRKDPRLLVVCGPCSIHDPKSALEYGQRLKQLSDRIQDQIYLVMRVYFEKPRTALGWKGFISDPARDNSGDMTRGLYDARQLLIALSQWDLPLAMEALDPTVPLYLGDIISWSAIGARTAESQTHREMASALPMPVGFKNGTCGNVDVAIHGMRAAAAAHQFIGVNGEGKLCMLTSSGNRHTHLILRGGITANYDADSVNRITAQLLANQLAPAILIDCSHGNCGKNYRKQIRVVHDVMTQIQAGNRSIIGLMLESHLNPGNQSPYLPDYQLQYGVSVTDPCLGWQDTESALLHVADTLRQHMLTPTAHAMLG